MILEKKGLLKLKLIKKNDLALSFEELYEIFRNNNIEFKQDEELKEYQNKVQNYNEEIQKNRKKLNILIEYNKVLEAITQLVKELNSKGSKIDDFVDLDIKLVNLEKKHQERENFIDNLEKEIFMYNQNIQDLTKIINDVEVNPSKVSLITVLNKNGIKIDRNDTIVEQCKRSISNNEKKIKQSQTELITMKHDKESTLERFEKTKKEMDITARNIRETAKQFGYLEVGEFISYYKPHLDNFKNYLKNTITLHTRLKNLKDDIVKVIEGGKPKNKAHTKIINSEFDEIFKNIYGRKEFFEYVFKDYTGIKEFDIGNKTIIFENVAGLEETRDLEEFSSGEKTYAYCRSIISMTANIAKYNIVILDESYALLDHEHSQNLYQFQEEMVQKKGITKFINILPLKENLEGLITIVEKKSQGK